MDMGSVNPWVGSTRGLGQPMVFVNPWILSTHGFGSTLPIHGLSQPMSWVNPWVGLGLTFSLSRGLGLVGTDFCTNN